jgi:hypothetical protein
MKTNFCYVVQEITCTETEILGGSVKGVYTTLPMAQKAVKEFRKKYKKKQSEHVVLYEILMHKVDDLPLTDKDMEKTLEGLIKRGLMEPLVGEDGYFYYELTDLGEKMAKKLSGGLLPKDEDEDEEENGGE